MSASCRKSDCRLRLVIQRWLVLFLVVCAGPAIPAALACASGCTGSCATPTSGIALPLAPTRQEISTTTLKTLIDQKALTVVEVRSRNASDSTKIRGAKILYLGDSSEVIAKALPGRDRMIVVYSQETADPSGTCVAAFQSHLRVVGYSTVILYREGFARWVEAGCQVEPVRERWPFRNL